MTLPSVPLDSANEKQHRTLIATTLNELVKQFPQHGDWTASIRGAGTAGTYEIASQFCRYTRIGRRVWLNVLVTMGASVTGGGTSNLQIIGAPFSRMTGSGPVGEVSLSGVDLTAGTISIALSFDSGGSSLEILQTSDNAAVASCPISGLAANDVIIGSICYETDDP